MAKPSRGALVALGALCAFVSACSSIRCPGGGRVDFVRRKIELVDEPALTDAPLQIPTDGGDRPVAGGLAWRVQGQETVSLFLSTAPIRCENLALEPGGPRVTSAGDYARLEVAPVYVDAALDRDGVRHAIVPTRETWRVTHVSASNSAAFHDFLGSNGTRADDARGAFERGRRTRLRIVAKGLTRSLAGAFEVEGCGEAPFVAPVRLQPDLDARLGERKLPIRSAVYWPLRRGGGRLRLTSASATCTQADPADVVIEVEPDASRLEGGAMASLATFAVFGAPAPAVDGGASLVRVPVRGVRDRPSEPPFDDVDARGLLRWFVLSGTVAALPCPASD